MHEVLENIVSLKDENGKQLLLPGISDVIKEIEFLMRCYIGRYIDRSFKSMEMLEVF